MGQSIIYSGSDQSFVAPDDADIILSGSKDMLALGMDDTVLNTGSGNVISGISPAEINLGGNDNTVGVNGGTVQALAATSVTLSGRGTLGFIGLGTTYVTFLQGASYAVQSSSPSSSVPLNFYVDPGASVVVTGSTLPVVNYTGGAVYLPDDEVAQGGPLPMAGSVRIDAPDAVSSEGVIGEIQGYAGPGGTGNRLYDIKTFQDYSSEAIMPGPGAFGVFEIRVFGLGGGGPTTVYDIANGQSISTSEASGEALDTQARSQAITFSGLDLSGRPIKAVYDYYESNRGSSVVLPANGAFGVFRTNTYYSGADGTGVRYGVSDDIGNGTSSSEYTANGAYGISKITIVTDGYDATGTIRRLSLDDVNGMSFNFNDTSGSPEHETETITSGHDGTGSVLATMTVQAGTDVNDFRAFTGENFPAAAFPIPLDLGDDGPVIPAHLSVGASPTTALPAMTLSDFAASPSAASRALTTKASVAVSLPAGPIVSSAAGQLLIPSPHHDLPLFRTT